MYVCLIESKMSHPTPVPDMSLSTPDKINVYTPKIDKCMSRGFSEKNKYVFSHIVFSIFDFCIMQHDAWGQAAML